VFVWFADVEAEMSDDLWLSELLRNWQSVGREDVPWCDVAERIDEAWLKSKYFGPPSVNIRALIRTVAEAASPPQQANNTLAVPSTPEQSPIAVNNDKINKPTAAADEAPDDVEAECGKWLATLSKGRRITKEQARKSFNESQRKANRKSIGIRPFKRAWKKAVPLAWRAPGRILGT
jgi:hypothetical protein